MKARTTGRLKYILREHNMVYKPHERAVKPATIDKRREKAEKAGAPGAQPLAAQHLERGDRNIVKGKKAPAK
jgi:hypothetical protein